MTRDELEFSISQFADGTLPEPERAAVEARCAQEAEARVILDEDRALTDLLRSEPLPDVRWDRLAASISEAIDEQAEERAARASFWMRLRLPAGLAVAASALLAIGIAAHVLLHRHDSVSPAQPRSDAGHVTVATLTVQGPQEEAPGGPEVTQVAIGAGGTYAKDASLDPYADEIDSRPARVVIASGVEPDRPGVGSPF